MSKSSPQMRTMQKALQECGGEAALAKVLNVPAEALSRWLTAREVMPVTVYFRVLDLVAAGRRKITAR